MNTAGECWSIDYLAWDNSRWTARLGTVSPVVQVNGAVLQVADPVFQHFRAAVGTVDHEDDRIGYITGGGGHWSSKCHSHSDFDGHVTFTFEHFRSTSMDDADHEDGTIVFKDWDGSLWVASVKPIADAKTTCTSPFVLRR